MIAVWKLATPCEFRTIANLSGIGRSTACEIFHEVCNAIANVLTPRYIVWPKGRELERVMNGFLVRWGYPQCAGSIDGTRIPIITPHEHHCDYFNRKGWHSIICQAIVDHEYIFRSVECGWCGRHHDASCLKSSFIF